MPENATALGDFFGAGIMGDDDRNAFHYNESLSYNELLELLERNSRMSMMCQGVSEDVMKNGIEFEEDATVPYPAEIDEETEERLTQSEHLDNIEHKSKGTQLLTYARLHGDSMALLLTPDQPDLEKALPEGQPYSDYTVHHRFAGASGWRILKTDTNTGEPTLFELKLMTEKMDRQKTWKIPAERVVIFKNPKKRQTWSGTPSSRMIGHLCLIEELLLKYLTKHGLDIASPFWLFNNIRNEDQKASLKTEMDKSPLKYLWANNIEIEPMSLEIQGHAEEFATMFDIIKDYIASAIRCTRQALDGAPEGTVSSAQYNVIYDMSHVQNVQEHFKPQFIRLFRKLGFPKPKFEYVKPMGLPELEGQDQDPNNQNEENQNEPRYKSRAGNQD